MTIDRHVPEPVWHLFWDCDPSNLRVDHDGDFIIDRVLLRGDLPEVRWLLDAYGREAIGARVRATRGRGFSRKALLFWSRRLGIPAEEATLWLSEPRHSVFHQGLGS